MSANPQEAPPKPLYVSMIIGGSSRENASAIAAVNAVGRLSDELSERVEPEGLKVDLTFHVPGPIVSPDYEGVRTGRYVPAKELLVVQAAVPVPLNRERAQAFMADVLRRTAELATGYVERRKLGLSTAAVEKMITEMLEELHSLRFE
jgi:hypothetical protein